MGTGIRFKSVKPPGIDAKAMRFELLNGLRLVRTQMLFGFHETTKTWDHKPDFVGSKPSLADGEPAISVETDDDIYTLVNEGSPRHYIQRGADSPLFYSEDTSPKTQPGVIDSFEGHYGERTEYREWVDHPGFPGRHFDEAIGATLQDFFLTTMQEAMRRAARASGMAL